MLLWLVLCELRGGLEISPWSLEVQTGGILVTGNQGAYAVVCYG